MTESNEIAPSNDNEMREILETLLANDEDITARAVGELGGFSKWAKFYEPYREARDKFGELGALPEATVSAMPPDSRVKPARGPAKKRR